MNKELFLSELSKRDILCSEKQYEQLMSLMKKTLEANAHFNLTSITDESEFIEKMLFDSALGCYGLDFTDKKILDLGTGGGFPGMVLYLLNPKGKFTLLDSTKKKIDYLKDLCEKNNYSVKCINDRAESYAKNHLEEYDYVTTRAVSQLPILLELSIPMLKVGGTLIAYKGPETYEEIENAQSALSKLGCKVESIYSDELPDSHSKRFIIYITKLKKTHKKYPRDYSEIKKLPL